MSKYRQPNSKRKQKSRAKREEKEMCQSFMIHTDVSRVNCAQTPEEFILAEAQASFTPTEQVIIKRKRRHKEPKQLSAAA